MIETNFVLMQFELPYQTKLLVRQNFSLNKILVGQKKFGREEFLSDKKMFVREIIGTSKIYHFCSKKRKF